jgi:uncharacterized membrane protein
MQISKWPMRFARRFSEIGLVVGAVLFSLALTPSLLPREALVQGLLSGCAFAIGYCIGVLLEWLWNYLGFRLPVSKYTYWFKLAVAAGCVILMAACLYQTAGWQDSVRAVMGLQPVESQHPLWVLLIALGPAIVLILLGRLFAFGVRLVSYRLTPFVPKRVALVGSVIVVSIVVTTLFNGVLLRGALRAADEFFLRLDGVAGQFGDPPVVALRSGSAGSLIAWSSIGRDGRIYANSGPTKADIEAVTGRPAIEPLRVSVGLRSAPSTEARAQLALAELKRVGAFERSVLLIVTPVGTGWVDPAGMDTLEYLLAGDVASVSLQYSYLLSPLSLIVEPDYGIEAAQELFNVVYGYWTTLPHDQRPRLYLNGLSLGAHASQASAQLFDVLSDPFDGALWAGPPFTSGIWQWATANRRPDSPEWRPRFGNQTIIRFTNNGSGLDVADVPWGPIRIAFLQHASDPIVFFDYATVRREPDWMKGERGADVSSILNWYPVVTFLQMGMDMSLALNVPPGYGHNYSAGDYIDAWRALIGAPGWDDAAIAELKLAVAARLAAVHQDKSMVPK